MSYQSNGMAMSTAASGSNLNHIYFFTETTPVTHPDVTKIASTPIQSSLNPSSTSTPVSNSVGSAALTPTSTSNSDMNPLAEEFKPASLTPPAPPPVATGLYELRETSNRGLGLFAISQIKRGTLIICEQALLKIPRNSLDLVWAPYINLTETEKVTYDHLHSFTPAYLQPSFENAINHIITDPSVSKSDIPTLTRAISIFNTNAFSAAPPGSLAVYATASRLNHSCVPNVHHSSNPTLGRLTVHAVRDIEPGEELLTTYIGGPGAYQPRVQRIQNLHTDYGFMCQCPSCSDYTGQSDHRRRLMGAIAWGLNRWDEQHGTAVQNQQDPYVPINSSAALRQAEDLIGILIAEGLVTLELTKAYRKASNMALQVQDYQLALEYAENELVVERNCLGDRIDDLWAIGTAAGLWVQNVREAMSNANVSNANSVNAPDGGKSKKKKKWKKNAAKGKANDGGAATAGDGVGAENGTAENE